MKLIRIRLSTGDIRHLHADDREPDFGIRRLAEARPPFQNPWLETTEGATVNREQIVEAYPHLAESAPNAIED